MARKGTKVRTGNALLAMEALGIPNGKAKPVLKHLLMLYNNNWTLIEEENYRALADAIFDRGESEAEDALDEETPVNEEAKRPLKRLQRRHHDNQTSSSIASRCSTPKTSILRPNRETDALPQSSLSKLAGSHDVEEMAKENGENRAVNRPNIRGHSISKEKGKTTVFEEASILAKKSDAGQHRCISSEQKKYQLHIKSTTTHPMALRERGNGSVFPPVSSTKKRLAHEISSLSESSKEPKVDSSAIFSPKRRSSTGFPEDDSKCDGKNFSNVKDPVSYSNQSNGGDLLSGHKKRREGCMQKSPPANAGDENEVVTGTFSQKELVDVTEVPITTCGHSSLEIVGSSSGEIKMFLRLDLNPGKKNFCMPDLKSVMKSVQVKGIQQYKCLDHSISLCHRMLETYQCCLELGSISNSGRLKPSDAIHVNEAMNKSSSATALGSAVSCCNTIKGSDSPLVAEVPHGLGSSNMGTNDEIVKDGRCQKIFTEESNGSILNAIDKPQHSSGVTPPLNDIAKGEEKIEITLVNEVSNEPPPSFCYLPQNAVFENAYVSFCMARIGDDNCCASCSGDCLTSPFPCACADEIGGEFAYTPDGVVKDKFLKESISMNRTPKRHRQFFCKECPLERSKCEGTIDPCKGHLVRRFIKECWRKCGCGKQCGNRVVQRGITRKLQVFMTSEGKGWGLRTLEDLPKGAFVCEYVGEVLTNAELFERVSRRREGEKHSYPVLLDADWCTEGVLKDEEALCLDATHYGNVARFINHRCYDSNMVEIPVEVETPDHHYYHLAFFTTRKVKALEELTWDYGIDFDDEEHPIEAFQCQCDSKFCRNVKRSRSATQRRRR